MHPNNLPGEDIGPVILVQINTSFCIHLPYVPLKEEFGLVIQEHYSRASLIQVETVIFIYIRESFVSHKETGSNKSL